MPRRYINELGHQESVNEIYLAADKQLRPNRNGNLYLQVELADRGGTIGARMWNANESIYKSFEKGDYVRVEGSTQVFQGAVQMIVNRIAKVDPAEVNADDFIPQAAVPVDKLMQRLREMLRGMTDAALLNLAECYLLDESLVKKLSMAPAGTKNHHAYHGGLLEHIVSLMELTLRVAPCYPQIDRDMLLMGAFLHDLGKVDELSYDRGLAYTDEGQLIGHLIIAVEMLDRKIDEAEKLSGEKIPTETALRLKHIILSHHGEYAFGSPKLPMTLEAIALYCLDNLDAKINSFHQLISEDPNTDSSWTVYQPNIDRKLFKGAAKKTP
jgi:3'-5' exoribonuclease